MHILLNAIHYLDNSDAFATNTQIFFSQRVMAKRRRQISRRGCEIVLSERNLGLLLPCAVRNTASRDFPLLVSTRREQLIYFN